MTKIEWTGQTWNPITGCTKVSPGCKNCYAERMAKRLKAMGKPQYQNVIGDNGKWNGVISFVESALEKPLKRKKPTTYFVNSMSDLFHDGVPDIWIDQIFEIMAACPQHTFQILSKRPGRMKEYIKIMTASSFQPFRYEPLPNVWLGVSVENQAAADELIPHLLQTPAIRFLSCEPLLGPIDFKQSANLTFRDKLMFPPQPGKTYQDEYGIHWIIAGGETGPNARPCHPDWVRSIRDQCQAASVPFFMKQMDKKQPIPEDLFIREYPKNEHVYS